ncbi:MAG: AtpZ/AtpI family protein [Alphaproteobacteria bacterium]|nr:AtpZ/AtpI family protein [Alphaproteobacteria bacterium]
MTADKPPPSLEDLDRRLREARSKQDSAKTGPSRATSIGQALRLATEMASAVFVGAVMGWGLDELLGTRPWLLLLFLALGMAAGTLNAYRTAMRLSAATEEKDTDGGPSA